jgi:hypothetical protein
MFAYPAGNRAGAGVGRKVGAQEVAHRSEENPMTETGTTTAPTDIDSAALVVTVDRYLDGLNETDPGRRADLVAAAWTEHGQFLDPLLEAEGHEALGTMIENIHGLYPGHRFARTSGIDAHHGLARFTWEMRGPDGSLTVAGLDVAEVAADGRLRSVTGFFGELPAAD